MVDELNNFGISEKIVVYWFLVKCQFQKKTNRSMARLNTGPNKQEMEKNRGKGLPHDAAISPKFTDNFQNNICSLVVMDRE